MNYSLSEPLKCEPIKIGVAGFGKLGLLHAATLSQMPDVELTCVVDLDSSTLNYFSHIKPNLPVTSDLTEKLNDLDAVVIATPTDSHVALALMCLKAGQHVFIEKPLASDFSQCAELVALAQKTAQIHMVGYVSRYIETFGFAKKLLELDCLGRPQNFSANMYVSQVLKAEAGWRFSKRTAGGGVVNTQNSHLIDLLVWYMGDVDFVQSHLQSIYSREVEDSAHVWMQFKSGWCGYFDSSWSKKNHRVVTMQIELQGENGTLLVNDDEVVLFLEKSVRGLQPGWQTWKKMDLFQPVEFDIAGPQFYRQMRAFVDSIKTGNKQNQSDILSAAQVQKVISQIYQSHLQNGARLTL